MYPEHYILHATRSHEAYSKEMKSGSGMFLETYNLVLLKARVNTLYKFEYDMKNLMFFFMSGRA